MRISPVFTFSFGSKRQFKKLFKTCAYSGEGFEQHDTKTIEHIKPLSEGGKNEYANFLVVKRSWNEKRSSKSLGQFIKEHPEVQENIVRTVNSQEGKTIEGINWSKEVRETLRREIGRDIF